MGMIVLIKCGVQTSKVKGYGKALNHTSDKNSHTLSRLQVKWGAEKLGEGEYPDILYRRLTSIRRQLENLGGPITDKTTTRRFMSAITKQHNHPYGQVVGSYRSQMIQRNPYKIDDLKEFLAVTFWENQAKNKEKEQWIAHKGLAVINKCNRQGGSHGREVQEQEPGTQVQHPQGQKSPQGQ